MPGPQKTRRTIRHEATDIQHGVRLRSDIAIQSPYIKGCARRGLVEPAFIHHASHGFINAELLGIKGNSHE
jgi:hypothetical protein